MFEQTKKPSGVKLQRKRQLKDKKQLALSMRLPYLSETKIYPNNYEKILKLFLDSLGHSLKQTRNH